MKAPRTTYYLSKKTNRRFVVLLFLCFFLVVNYSFAQRKTRQQLEQEKQRNLQKINELNQVLDKTASQKVASLGQVKILNRKIDLQTRQIDLLSDNLNVIEDELGELNQATTNLSHDLQQLKHEYGKMIFEAAKKNNSFNRLTFLFSARSFNDFSMRYQYLKQYTESRKKQVTQMERVRNLLFAKQAGIKTRKVEQEQVLVSKVSETKSLENLKQKQSQTVQQLSKQEKNIQSELLERKKAVALLDNRITSIIENEIAESRRRSERRKASRMARQQRESEARESREAKERERELAENKNGTKSKAPAKTPEVRTPEPEAKHNEVAMDEEEVTLASSFSKNKNRLPWPVNGKITEGFGKHQHSDRVFLDNNGVDIETQAGAAVKCVFDGIVLNVTNIQGNGTMIIVQHGQYFTVYSNLGNANVSNGQKVKAREVIGTLGSNREGNAEMNFQVWKNAQKMNPEGWLGDR